uniref:Uncharacterized protein n=1 Tax=Rhizophora mucronata TaxID=61149 RepID=A0A2P2Q147_RHIMU
MFWILSSSVLIHLTQKKKNHDLWMS